MRGLRITGGTHRGRNIKVPKDDVRPTQDMVREALFSILQVDIGGCRFLDLYGGSGAVGLEAWSRGADFVCWVEKHCAVHKTLNENVELLCDGGVRVIRGDVVEMLKGGMGGESAFEFIFADPPYRETQDGGRMLQELMRAIDAGGVLKEEGLFIMEMPKRGDTLAADGWEMVKERLYGHTKLCFYRRAG